jgi:hypothetical protein
MDVIARSKEDKIKFVELEFTDIFGKQVYLFSNAEISNNLIYWNGVNNNGQEVPSGIYFLNLIVGNQNKCIKLIKQ